MTRGAIVCGALLTLALAGASALAQGISGSVFEDRDGDGIRDPGEPPIEGVAVRVFGRTAGGAAYDTSALTGAGGSFQFTPGNGCYLMHAQDPPGWRLSQSREDGFLPSASYSQPVGQPRFAKLDFGIANLAAGALRYASMGDSIAWNFNLCGYPSSFWYSDQVRQRLACVAPTASVTLDEAAIKGEHTDDLLVDEPGELNNVYRIVEAQPDLITISIIGNDLLNVDPGGNPTQTQIDRAVAEVLDARQNLQEVLSVLLTELPQADVSLNTLYDNEAWACYSGSTGAFHRTWVPIVNRILRDLAWGQSRRVSINEVAAEFAHADQAGSCTGFSGLICRDLFLFDTIHPTNAGYRVIREKVWEAAGGVLLGPTDAQGRTSISDVGYGYLRRVRRLLPSTWQTANGATVQLPAAALDDADGGAAASVGLGAGTEEFRLGGFPGWYDEIRIVRVVAGVRYKTSGSVNDDFYRVEASVGGQFRPPPGFHYTPTAWNFFTPLVGGGGPNAPSQNPDYPAARVLARPNVPVYREVSATLSKNPVLPPGAAEYEWPALTHEELETTVIRVASAPVAGTPGDDLYAVEVDHAWLDLYGWEKPRPDEVRQLTVSRTPAGDLELAFDSSAQAQRYNLYAGRLATLVTGAYDHGNAAPAGPFCDAPTRALGAGRLAIDLDTAAQPAGDLYFLVTAHVDDVESPAGFASSGEEIDRAQSTCR